MQRYLTRSPLCVLLSGLLLAACGPVPESSEGPETLGVVEAAACSSSAVTSLTLSGISTYGGEMAGAGTYTVSYPANSVFLEYRIDGLLQSVQRVSGSTGTWQFSKAFVSCGTHTFNVKAWARVTDSAGGETICVSNPSMSLSQSVTEECPPRCGDGACNGNEDEWSCSVDCGEPCPASVCSDRTCCPSTGMCSDGQPCWL